MSRGLSKTKSGVKIWSLRVTMREYPRFWHPKLAEDLLSVLSLQLIEPEIYWKMSLCTPNISIGNRESMDEGKDYWGDTHILSANTNCFVLSLSGGENSAIISKQDYPDFTPDIILLTTSENQQWISSFYRILIGLIKYSKLELSVFSLIYQYWSSFFTISLSLLKVGAIVLLFNCITNA